MADPVIHLHVGEPKSGTTFLQTVLEENRHQLSQAGFYLPPMRQQVTAGQDGVRSRRGEVWRSFAAELVGRPEAACLVSMETLCRASGANVRRMVSAFGASPVRVHVTVRDIARSLPAQWQQSVQHRKTWSYEQYLGEVVDGSPNSPARRNFWSQHDAARIVSDWSAAAGSDAVTVVTVPPRGADPGLLWSRFANAVGLGDPAGWRLVRPANESLGLASTELVRRVNAELPEDRVDLPTYNAIVRGRLARGVLAGRAGEEPPVALPEAAWDWATAQSQRLVDALVASGVRVVGDLSDLRPTAPVPEAAVVADEGDVAAAAVAAMIGLLAADGALTPDPSPSA